MTETAILEKSGLPADLILPRLNSRFRNSATRPDRERLPLPRFDLGLKYERRRQFTAPVGADHRTRASLDLAPNQVRVASPGRNYPEGTVQQFISSSRSGGQRDFYFSGR